MKLPSKTKCLFHFSSHSSVAPALAKRKRKEDPEQENPSDTRDPSVEEKERLLALDKDICDEEDEKIAQDVVHKDQDKRDPSCGTKERKLVCVDETSKVLLSYFRTRMFRRCFVTLRFSLQLSFSNCWKQYITYR